MTEETKFPFQRESKGWIPKVLTSQLSQWPQKPATGGTCSFSLSLIFPTPLKMRRRGASKSIQKNMILIKIGTKENQKITSWSLIYIHVIFFLRKTWTSRQGTALTTSLLGLHAISDRPVLCKCHWDVFEGPLSFHVIPFIFFPGVIADTSSVLATCCSAMNHQHLAGIQQEGCWGWPGLLCAGNERGMHSVPSTVWSALCYLGTRSSLHFQDKSQSRHPWVLSHLFLLMSIKQEDISHVIRFAHPEAVEQNSQRNTPSSPVKVSDLESSPVIRQEQKLPEQFGLWSWLINLSSWSLLCAVKAVRGSEAGFFVRPRKTASERCTLLFAAQWRMLLWRWNLVKIRGSPSCHSFFVLFCLFHLWRAGKEGQRARESFGIFPLLPMKAPSVQSSNSSHSKGQRPRR